MELSTAMVADAAHVAGGKMYILGGQWDRLTVANFPAQHPAMAVALVLKIEYTEALTNHRLTVELMLDGEPQDVKAMGDLRMGHAPTQARGAPSFAPIALPFYGVTFAAPGRYEWVITVGDDQLGRIPIDVASGVVPVLPPTVTP